MASETVKGQTGSPIIEFQEMETTYNVCHQVCREETSSLFLSHLCGLTLSSKSYPKTLGACRSLSKYSVRQKDSIHLKSEIDNINCVTWVCDNNPHYPTNKSYEYAYNADDVGDVSMKNIQDKTVQRIAKEINQINKNHESLKNVSFFFNEDNIREMVFYFSGDCFNDYELDYQGGGYFVKILFPNVYPFGGTGPAFFMLTPNGRFLSESAGNNALNKYGICLPHRHNIGSDGEDRGWKPGIWVGKSMIPKFLSRFIFSNDEVEVGIYEPISHSLKDHQLKQALLLKRRQLAMESHAFNHELLKRDDMKFVKDSIEAYVETHQNGDDEKPEHFTRCKHLMSVIDGSGVQEAGTIENLANLVIQVKKHEKEELEQQVQKLEKQLHKCDFNTPQVTDKVKLQLSTVYCGLASLHIDGCFTNDDPPKEVVKKDINKAVQYYLKASKLDTNDGGFSDYMIAKIADVYEKILINKGSIGEEIHKNSEKRLWHLRIAEKKKHKGAIFMLKRRNEKLLGHGINVNSSLSDSVNSEDYYLGKILFKEYKQFLKDGCSVGQCSIAKENAKENLGRYVKACTQASNNSVRHRKNYREVKAKEYLLEITSDDYIKSINDKSYNKVSVSFMRKFAVSLKEFLLDNPFSGKVASILCCMTTAIQTCQPDLDKFKYQKEEKASIAIARANGIIQTYV